jgi:predicted permease
MPDFRAYVRTHLRLQRVSGAREAEIVEEIALDLEERYRRLVHDGIDPEEAWRQIQESTDWPATARAFRGALRPEAAAHWEPAKRFNLPASLLNNFRFAARLLLRNPGFTAATVLTLSICLGANLSIFAVIDSILLRPLPFPDAKRLVTTVNSYPLAGSPHSAASLPNYYDYRKKIKAFASTAIITRTSEYAIVGATGSPRRVERDRVSPEFFQTLGVPLLLGHSFSDDEMVYARSGVAILSYDFWKSYFNGDPKAVGRTFQMDGSTTTVAGVLPKGFRFLSRHTQIYIPAASDPAERAVDQRHNNRFQLIARLARGATLGAARAQVSALSGAQMKDDPFAATLRADGFRALVNELHEDHVENIKPTLVLLQSGVLLLLVIGGVNVVNLLLILASSRAKEVAIRQSLGASQWEVVRQALAETVLLTLTGGCGGLLVAMGGIRLLQTLGVDQLPLGESISFDWRIACAAFAGAVVLGAIIAVPVAGFHLRGRLAGAMQSESRGGTSSRAGQRLRHGFVFAQIALSFVLLSGAGLLGISLKHVLETSPGFQSEHLVTGQISLPYKKYPDLAAAQRLIDRLLNTLQAEPGITSAAITDLMPFGGDDDNGVTAVEGIGKDESGTHSHYRNGIAGEYWRTMGIPLLEGRFLNDSDRERKRRVCVVDRAFAERYWPGRSALGHRLNDGPVFKKDEAFTIVGVVAAVKQAGMDETKPLGTIYYPYEYWPLPGIAVVVRTPLTVDTIGPRLRQIVLQIDPDLPIDQVKPLDSLIDESMVTRRSTAVLAGTFAGVALLLTIIGTYGVLSFAVGQRRREIGVRMAIGAAPQQVLSHFLGLGMKLLLGGIALGGLGAWMTSQAMGRLLFGIRGVPLGVLATTVGVMATVVLMATFVPSYRASRISPTEALRED